MLIRVRGHNSGIKEYLENGQKQGRDMARDDMDERVILAGDLPLTHEIIESMNTSAERYLTVTMSFKEDDIEPQTLAQIVADFEQFAFSAYRRDEYVLYAEAHLPKIKSYANRRSGEPVERKPHIHLVIPAVNLLSGRRMEPFGRVDIQQKYIDAFQEHINHKYGLASPKDNRRVEFTDASEMISRYKGDVFEGSNARLKNDILRTLIEQDVTSMDRFREVLAQFGQIRTRNAGGAGEYLNVKPEGAPKGVNLKEFAFSRQFIELDAEAKQAALAATNSPKYETAGSPKATPHALLSTLREWEEVRAKEVKYLNGAFRAKYREMSPAEKRATLYDREQHFYEKYDNEDRYEQRHEQWSGLGRERRGFERGDPLPGAEIGTDPDYGPDWEFDPYAVAAGQAPGRVDGVRDLPRSVVDGFEGQRGPVLLPDTAYVQLEERESAAAERLRRDRARGRASGREGGREGGRDEATQQGRNAGLIVHDWREALEREYARYVSANDKERSSIAARTASKLRREFGHMKGGASLPPELTPRESVTSLADVADLHAAPSLSATPRRFEAVELDGVPLDAEFYLDEFPSAVGHSRSWGRSANSGGNARVARQQVALSAGVIGGDFERDRAGRPLPYRRPRTGAPTPRERPAEVPDVPGRYRRRHGSFPRNSATGRVVDSLTSQLERDRREADRRRSGGIRTEFQQIKQDLAADRLLGALAHSHGVMREKYSVWKGRDGADRIRCGSRSLNVSDFLTKEMHLSWAEASQILRKVYREQVDKDPDYQVRRPPQERLWMQFQDHRRDAYEKARDGWLEQGLSERARRDAIREDFRRTKGAVQDNPNLTTSEKRAAMSAARLERADKERRLRETIERERAERRASSVPRLDAHYREYLAERAKQGETAALGELRRIQHVESPMADQLAPALRGADENEPNAILYDGPEITREVQRTGVVTYSVDGNVALDDEARSLRVWSTDDPAVDLALRMAVVKFGGVLAVSGPDDFREAVALAAADAGIRVEFEDGRMNEIADSRRREIAEQHRIEREREAARRKAVERIAREAIMAPSLGKAGEPSLNPARDDGPPLSPDEEPER